MKKGFSFPIFKTKIEGLTKSFNLNNPSERREYFEAKTGEEIKKIKKYLIQNTFVAFLLGKKNAGKGTYSKLFMEAVGGERVGHVSVGDIVRDVHKSYETGKGKKELISFLSKNYRGFHGLEEIENIILGRNTTTLISSELIVALIKYEISKRPRQAIFIDGFPRASDQIGYSLFLKELIGYRDDPDFLIFINVPEMVIDERIKYRVICPNCKLSRSIKLAPTSKIKYDKTNKEFYLACDDPTCGTEARMVPKEGDELGIEPIRKRLEIDEEIIQQLLRLIGIPKVYLRNSVPVDVAWDYVDKYEVTPEYSYERDIETGEIRIIEKPWIIKDDDGVDSYSLLPAAPAVALIKQIATVLKL